MMGGGGEAAFNNNHQSKGNLIEDEGARMIGEALKRNNSLTWLCMHGNTLQLNKKEYLEALFFNYCFIKWTTKLEL